MKQAKIARAGWWAVVLLASVTVVFGVVRLQHVGDELSAGRVPSHPFDSRYVQHPFLSYLHILAGTLFFVLGPFQFLSRIRQKWLWLHRVAGRIYVVLGFLAGVSAILMALQFPAYGGLTTSSATLFFGCIFLFALGKALYHIRRREIALHRQWMIRGFAIGLGVSSIRLYILLFQLMTDYSFADSFGVSFWLAFCTHAAVAEWWIRLTE